MKLQMDVEKAPAVAQAIYGAYYSKEGILGWKGFKETVIPKGMKKGSGEHIFFITLALIVLDYNREKKKQWLACKAACEDKETRYLFIPEQIRWSSIKKVKRDLEKYQLSQNPMQDARYWKRIASSMHLYFQSDPYRFLEECEYEGEKVLNLIRSYRYRRGFPFLKSRRLAPVWLQLLYEQGGLPIKGMETFPLGVDSHIIRSTLKSGAVKGSYQGSMDELKKIIDGIWQEVCREVGLFPLQLKEPLWYLGRYGCRSQDQRSCGCCPVGETCLSSTPLQIKEQLHIQLHP